MPRFTEQIVQSERFQTALANLPKNQVRARFDERLAELQDPNSELYRNAEIGLMRLLNQTSPTVATLTSAQRAGGLSVGSASSIANKQRESSELRNREKASMASGQLFQRNQGLINNIINSSADFETRMLQLDEMRRQFDEQMDASFWNNIVNGLIGVGAIIAAPVTGGASLLAGGYLQSQMGSQNPQNSMQFAGYQPSQQIVPDYFRK